MCNDLDFATKLSHVANPPILYARKSSEKQRFSDVFQVYEIETLTRNGLNEPILSYKICF